VGRQVIIGALIALAFAGESPASPQVATPQADLARQLLEGCLAKPTLASVAALAAAVGARPHSDLRNRRELGKADPVYAADGAKKGEAQRTDLATTLYRGWDLPGPGAGEIDYQEQEMRHVMVDRVSGQELTTPEVSHTRSCAVKAPVANARRIFELYETLQADDYGALISPNRKRVGVFVYSPTSEDVELWFELDKPIPGLPAPARGEVMARLVLSDGGPRFINSAPDGVTQTPFTRAGLLAALDQRGEMSFENLAIEPVVQRLTSRAPAGGGR
jgi:hypothetical protein